MKPNQFKLMILGMITPVIIWLNYQEENINSPLERFNNIVGTLTTVSILLDSILKESSDSESE